ncbi:FadR/GntR family transcriptional regulator [Acuticoccus kandeliae]|uniref:FadR/GntR family transcriptional regulator n=1 Tax=Acuticoccus kandeliae TaxID=2073160 RepID=UPI000D3E9D04|nr:GntR family transcriptional regulator [Acuticoccus kandeliae]
MGDGSAAINMATARSARPRRVYEQIADRIRELILEKGMRAGDRLPAERDLATMFGVSRPSVREAMIALEAAGAIEVRTGDGTYVREIASTRMPMPWAKDGDPGPGPLEQFQARKLIEPELTARAAVMATNAEIAELSRLVDKMAEVYPTLGDFDDNLGHTFHTTLARAGYNGILAQIVEHLWDLRDSDMWNHLRRRVVTPANRRRAVADRRAIVAALEAHDAAGARAAMLALLERAEQRYFGDGPQE